MNKTDTQEDAEKIGDLIDELALTLDQFRTGTKGDREILIRYLKRGHGETYAYVTQMIKIFEQGENVVKAFLPFTAPPRIKRRSK